jgi:hypothetical protein
MLQKCGIVLKKRPAVGTKRGGKQRQSLPTVLANVFFLSCQGPLAHGATLRIDEIQDVVLKF